MRNLRHTYQKNGTSENELAALFVELADGDWFEDVQSLFESPYMTPWYETENMFVRINGRRIPIRTA